MTRLIQIRRAQSEDAAAIARVLYDSFIEFKALYTEQGFAATIPNAEQILSRMKEGPVWVAVRDSEVLGTVAAVVKDHSLYIRGMAVPPAGRGAGTGNRLLNEVESYASTVGCRRLFLSTTPFLGAAIRLYERHDFRRTSEGPYDLFGTQRFAMEKTVSHS